MATPSPMAAFVRILQDAHAGELAAAHAYRGHWRSRWREPAIRREIRRIEDVEWHHRRIVAAMLGELRSRPRRPRELLMWSIGRLFGALCFVSLRFGPMYAAGRLEAMNVDQYAAARRLADLLGLPHFVDALSDMEREEVRHEVFFARQCDRHRFVPIAVLFGGWDPRTVARAEFTVDVPAAADFVAPVHRVSP